MLSPLRVFFHVRNRRGLGHMMRGLNMACALKTLDPQAELLFHLRAAPAPGFWPEGMAHVVDDGHGAVRTAVDFAPHVQVFDTLLPGPDELQILQRCVPGGLLAYVMRRCLPHEQAAVYEHPALAAMDCVLVPHTPAEFGLDLPPGLTHRCHFVGPICRLPDPLAQQALATRYDLRPHEFLLTSTVGGGGFAEQAATFFGAVAALHRQLMAKPAAAPLRHVVVLGPNFEGEIEALPGMTVVRSEPDLVNLLALSQLVIAEGGYNTVSELTWARTPALFLPSRRGKDDQFERVQRLADAGCARVFDAGDVPALACAVQQLRADPAQLATMRQSYPQTLAAPGNLPAARLLLQLAQQARVGAVAPAARRVDAAAALLAAGHAAQVPGAAVARHEAAT
jgi:predicted glycosyltransferase